VGQVLFRDKRGVGVKGVRFAFRAWAFLLALHAGAAAQITVATAANVRYAMEELRREFRRETGIEVKAVYGASGKLADRIRDGAPFDVFVSADMDFPDSLHAWGDATERPRTYAYGKLVLWTIGDLDLKKGMAVLADPGVSKIALADPGHDPYGREALKALQRAGLAETLEPRLVRAENISQVGRLVLSGEADIGFDAKSIVLALGVVGKGHWREVDSTLYDRIAQGAVICKYGEEKHPGPSSRFYAFLYSTPARVILNRYGYRLP
jgi:molybdate transport system substrate-binding protein